MKKDAESKEKVFRSRKTYFNRIDLCEAFIKREKYGESISRKNYACFICDYLIDRAIYSKIKEFTKEEIKASKYFDKRNFIAVIDRVNKKIAINSHSYYTYDLTKVAKFYGYDIFTVNSLTYGNILEEKNTRFLYQEYIKYLVNEYCQSISNIYYSLYISKFNKFDSKQIYDKLQYDYFPEKIRELIKSFTDKYLVGKYYYLRREMVNNITYITMYSKAIGSFNVVTPTIEAILTNKVLSEYDYKVLEDKYIYTTYCYGFGISYNELINRIDTIATKKEVNRFREIYKIKFNCDLTFPAENFNDLSWRNVICILYNKLKIAIEHKESDYKVRSINNKQEAKDKIEECRKDYNKAIKFWRESNYNKSDCTLIYKYYEPGNSPIKFGEFVTIKYPIPNIFKTYQFKLVDYYTVISQDNFRLSKPRFIDFIKEVINNINVAYLYSTVSTKSNTLNIEYTISSYFKYEGFGPVLESDKKWLDENNNYSVTPCNKQLYIEVDKYRLWLDDIKNFIDYLGVDIGNKFNNIIKICSTNNKLKKW